MDQEITLADLDRIYIVVPNDNGIGTANLTVSEMSDRQFRNWIKAKAELEGVRIILPVGRVGHETRVHMLNRLAQAGVRIYMVPLNPFQA